MPRALAIEPGPSRRLECRVWSILPLVALLLPSVLVAQGPVVRGASYGGLDSRSRGEVLFGELGCGACHAEPKVDPRVAIPRRSAPDLATVGGRIAPEYLQRYLLDPHGVAPGTVMPDVLPGKTASERAEAALLLTHYLVSLADRAFERGSRDPAAAARGQRLFHSIGCVACHAPRDDDGRERAVAAADVAPLGDLGAKYGVESLMGFLSDPHAARASGRMPDFKLEPGQARDLSHYLVGVEASAASEWKVDPQQAVRGRELFGSSQCVRCHVTTEAAQVPAQELVPIRKLRSGCCAEGEGGANPGVVPRFDLSDAQRDDLIAFLDPNAKAPTEEHATQVALARLDCLACHQRAAPGRAVGQPRGGGSGSHFATTNQNLGLAGRFPPSLHGIGAKIQPAWLAETLAYGQSARPYLLTRMPGFGGANTQALAQWLSRIDASDAEPIAALPSPRKEAEVVRKLGRTLTGDRGMNCIACHTFRGKQVGAMGAIDLVETTGKRLQSSWFRRYMLDPAGSDPGTIMPLFFPGGQSIRAELADGDAERQIAGLWHYFAEGRNTREPPGLRPPPIELRVGDQAVMLRRKIAKTGKRAIAVGYPGGVNLLFDAETLLLDRVWWGRFLNAAGVWTGQGHGNMSILERDVVRLVPEPAKIEELPAGDPANLDEKFVHAPAVGPPFAPLSGPRDPWPKASRRDLGMAFLGYELDAARRPTFEYRGYGLKAKDRFTEQSTEGSRSLLLRRVVTFGPDGSGARSPDHVFVRLATHGSIQALDASTVRVGQSLRIRSAGPELSVRSLGGASDVIVRVALEDGRGELVVEYLRGGEVR